MLSSARYKEHETAETKPRKLTGHATETFGGHFHHIAHRLKQSENRQISHWRLVDTFSQPWTGSARLLAFSFSVRKRGCANVTSVQPTPTKARDSKKFRNRIFLN